MQELPTLDMGHPIRIPSGLVHYWVAVIFTTVTIDLL
jgi:hypothetical protein